MKEFAFPILLLLVVAIVSAVQACESIFVRQQLKRMGYAQLRRRHDCRIEPVPSRRAVGAFAALKDGVEATLYVTVSRRASGPYDLQVSSGVDGHVTRIEGGVTLMTKAMSWGRQHIAYPTFAYLCAYALSASFGGYNPYYNTDGMHAYGKDGPLAHTAIMWEPRIGTYLNQYNNDFIGCLFYPLLWIDRRYLHKTHYIFDQGFGDWARSLSESDIHPDHRKAFRELQEKADLKAIQKMKDKESVIVP